MGMMDKMMEKMMGRMSGEKKEDMMSKMMENPKMMEMMPKMMMGMMGGDKEGGGMMGMMSKMMGGEGETDNPMMGGMMMEMIPQCLRMMLPGMDKEKRTDFVLEMVATLKEQACADMSDAEKEALVNAIIEKAKS